MKTTIAAVLASLIGYATGYHSGSLDEGMHLRDQLAQAHSQVERFHNQEVFEHAKHVANVTGTPFYQVLSGKKAR